MKKGDIVILRDHDEVPYRNKDDDYRDLNTFEVISFHQKEGVVSIRGIGNGYGWYLGFYKKRQFIKVGEV